MRKIVLFISICFVSFFAESQNTGSLIIENKIYTGYIVNNFLKFENFPERKISVINSLTIGKKTDGTKDWHGYYKFPEISVSILTGTLGNKNEFGYIFGIVPNITFDINKFKYKNISLTFGWGISYTTKPYDSISNPYNILLGSNLNNTALIGLNFRKEIKDNLFCTFGFAYLHASNGHYQVPNGGLNLAEFSFGVKKIFHNSKPIQNDQTKDFNKKFDFNFNAGIGIHELAGTIGPTGTPKYYVYSYTFLIGKNYNKWGKYFFGFSYKYYESYYNQIVKTSIFNKNLKLNSSVITFELAHEFFFGKFSLLTQGGLNVYMPFVRKYLYKNELSFNISKMTRLFISTKLGMRYYFFNPDESKFNIFVTWAIKANFGSADFNEISFGFVF